jgi:hypothetical protein
LLDEIELSQLPIKLGEDFGDTLIPYDASSAGLALLANEVRTRKTAAARQAYEAPAQGNVDLWPEAKADFFDQFGPSAWYAVKTLLLIVLTLGHGFWVTAITIALLKGDPSVTSGAAREFMLGKLFLSGTILAVCLYFWWNRIRGLFDRRKH